MLFCFSLRHARTASEDELTAWAKLLTYFKLFLLHLSPLGLTAGAWMGRAQADFMSFLSSVVGSARTAIGTAVATSSRHSLPFCRQATRAHFCPKWCLSAARDRATCNPKSILQSCLKLHHSFRPMTIQWFH